tara:strand:+ start:652 stop:948 length:297 start_codon:yes stop_codon:yes gene_type:complete
VEELVLVGVVVPVPEDVVEVVVPVEKLTEPFIVLLKTTEFNENSKAEGSGTNSYVPLESLNVNVDSGLVQVISSNSMFANCSPCGLSILNMDPPWVVF